MEQKHPLVMLPILLSTTACISLWFAGNAVMGDLQAHLSLPPSSLGWISSAVHLGFIAGTLLFAYFSISDRFPARTVYFLCATLGALTTLSILLVKNLAGLLSLRIFTGILLAGIYPVGMKIAFSWYRESIGTVLGFLLGAFAVGTALPHLLHALGADPDWKVSLVSISLLTIGGGIVMLVFVPDGPHLPRRTSFTGTALIRVFRSPEIRSASLGYFGHMWELYSFWVFVPLYMITFFGRSENPNTNIQLCTFLIISSGCIGCVLGGFLSESIGSARVAFTQLSLSGICCLLSPLLVTADVPASFFLSYLCLWGISVVGDSPQFSAIVAGNADRELVGTSLTVVNCVGFLISIFSIELTGWLYTSFDPCYAFLFLAPGPLLGLVGLSPLVFSRKK